MFDTNSLGSASNKTTSDCLIQFEGGHLGDTQERVRGLEVQRTKENPTEICLRLKGVE